LFSEYLKNAKSTIFFSATLHPFDYFCEILSSDSDDNKLSLRSPFPADNFGLYVYTGIKTHYQYRDDSYLPIAELIQNICSLKFGNYIVYFPSFSFLNKVYEQINNMGISNLATIFCQKPSMSEKHRADFLSNFENVESAKIGFAVLGGIFSEGIDLIGDKLIGVFVVTVGLPGLGNENSLIQNYYDDTKHAGFDYAYKYPGFNKVMQAAGRVIRSETDRGIVVLIDTRYSKNEYKELYPVDWRHFEICSNLISLSEKVSDFWSRESNLQP
jgi:DNA excision repair protein ERCC-2